MFFTKMSCYGNDYLYVDCFSERVKHPGQEAKWLCNRHDGIGADGLVLLCPSERADFRMRIIDPDGTEAEMCGNALRSSAYLFRCTHRQNASRLTVETLAGIRSVWFPRHCVGKQIRTDFGKPIIHFLQKELDVSGEKVLCTSLSFGNPHLVVLTDDLSDKSFFRLGPALETHPMFPERTNVEFVRVLGTDLLKLRTWERGCGETLSCSTGSAAAMVAAHLSGMSDRKALVEQSSGHVFAEWLEDNTVLVTGDTRIVFTGFTNGKESIWN